MHETIIAQNIITKAEEQGEIKSITLEIGELAHVPPEELIECMKKLKPNWRINYTEIPAQAACICSWSGHPTILERGHDHFMIECPQCQSVPQLQSGTEIKLIEVEVNEVAK